MGALQKSEALSLFCKDVYSLKLSYVVELCCCDLNQVDARFKKVKRKKKEQSNDKENGV